MLRPDMIIDAHVLWLIQTTDGDLNAVIKHCFVHAECASACRAEATLRECRRSIAGRFTADPSEVFNAKVNEGHHRGARVPSAHGAVTKDAANRR